VVKTRPDQSTCYFCGRTGHWSKTCPFGQQVCYYCYRPGHKANECQKKKQQQALVPARTFALNNQDAQTSGSIIHTVVNICDIPASVLIDPGSTHSFVSILFVAKLGRTPEPLDSSLLVGTPMGDSLLAELVFRGCVVKIREQ